MESKRTPGVLPSIDSSETRRIKEEFLGGIKELDELRLGTDVKVWMPPEVEDNIGNNYIFEKYALPFLSYLI